MDLGSNDESEAMEPEESSEVQVEQPSELPAPPSLNPSVVLGSGMHLRTATREHR